MKCYVQLKLFATLSKKILTNESKIEINSGSIVKDLLNMVGIKPDEVKLIFINGLLKKIDSELHDGDRVGIFPPVGGG